MLKKRRQPIKVETIDKFIKSITDYFVLNLIDNNYEYIKRDHYTITVAVDMYIIQIWICNIQPRDLYIYDVVHKKTTHILLSNLRNISDEDKIAIYNNIKQYLNV